MKRHVLIAAGTGSLLLGILGAVLPVLPTTPFLILAVTCYSRSSPRLAHWLRTHPQMGPPLRAWQEDGAIGSRSKAMAVIMMAISASLVILGTDVPLLGKTLVAIVIGCCAIFILSRPRPQIGSLSNPSRASTTKSGD